MPGPRMNNPDSVIELRAGRAEVGVAPGIGGSIAYFRWTVGTDVQHWLRPASPADLASLAAGRLACFPLVPYSNRIRAGSFAFRGRAVRLPRDPERDPHALHGHGWRAAWSVVERYGDRLTIAYAHAADAWPFPYRARQDFALTDAELRVTLTVENAGRDPMPAGLGLHPYFPRTARGRLSAVVDAMWATDAEMLPTALTAVDPQLADGDGLPLADAALDNVFTGWRRRATIRWPERGAQLAMDADPPLDFLVVYTPPGNDYFCAEPVSHCTDAFNLAARGRGDTGMLTLAPGAGVSATVRFRPRLT
jgi:aldose 1-epimerase